MAMFPTPFTVTHITRTKTGENELGQAVFEETSRVRKVYGWQVLSLYTASVERDQATSGGRVIADLVMATPDGDYAINDKVIIEGRPYEVEGDIFDANKGPFGFQPGYLVYLKKVEMGR